MKGLTGDMIKTNKKMCRGCIHSYHQDNSSIWGTACHYIVDTGKSRGCPVGWCNKYEPRKRRRRKAING